MTEKAKKPKTQTYSFQAWKSYLHNLAAVLTVAVVIGHYADQCLAESWVSKGLYLFVFSFHMPLLFFLAGTFYRDLEQDKEKVRQTALFSFCLYILMKLVIGLVRTPFTGAFSFSLFRESGAPWIFFALAVFFLAAQVMGRVSKVLLLSASVLLALVCGYTGKIRDFLALSRLIVFFPFFVFGWMTGIERAERWTGKTSLRILGAAALILAFILSTVMCQKVYFMRPMFTGRNAYTSLGGRQLFGPAYRLLAYGVSTVLAAAVLAVTPRRSLGKLVDALGERALAVYFWHRPILYLLTSLWGYSAFEQALGWKMGRIAWVLCGLVCAAILSIRIFQRPFLALYRVVERPREFPRRLRDGVVNSLPINSRKKCVAWYSITFAVAFTLCFLEFVKANRSLVFNPDGGTFHVQGLMVLGSYLRRLITDIFHGKLSLFQYNFNIGLGMDQLLYVLPSYAEPLNLLGIFVPPEYTEHLYTIIIVIRYYLTGLALMGYCFYMKKEPFPTYIAALAYAFCGYTFYGGARHPYFLAAMIYLPILLIGIEDTLKGGKISKAFILSVFVSFISSYYFLYMNTFFCAAYFLLRFPEVGQKGWKSFWIRVFGVVKGYLLGLGMGAAWFVPNILAFFHSNRQAAIIDPNNWPFYTADYVKGFFAYWVTPWKGPGKWTYSGFIAISFICLIILLIKVKKHRALKIGYALMSGSLLLPVCAFVMVAFTTIVNRRSFQLAFVNAVTISVALSYLPELKDRDYLKIFAGICVYGVYIALTKQVRNIFSIAGFTLLLFTFICVYIAEKQSSDVRKRQAIISASVLLCILVHGYMSFSPNYGNGVAEYLPSFSENISDDAYVALGSSKGEFSRIDSNYIPRKELNASVPLKINSTSVFYNVLDANYVRYLTETEDADVVDRYCVAGLDSRGYLLEANQVKYWATKDGSFPVPYGYREVESKDERFELYENQYFLPLGYTYDRAMSELQFEKLNSVEKQEAMLQSVLLEDTKGEEIPPKLTSTQLDYEVVKYDGLSGENGSYKIEKNNATVQIRFTQQDNAEHYLRFRNMDVSSSGPVNWTFKATNDLKKYTTTWHVRSKTNENADFLTDFTVNLGYTIEGGIAVYTITFPSEGTFTLDGLEVYAQSMENYAAYVDELSEDTLDGLKIGLNTVKGTISLDREKYLYFSIPYSTGWKATVDGEKADILRANIAFMAIPVGPGDHEIVLTYHTPGVAVGAGISAASLALFLALLRRGRRRKTAETEVLELI